MALKKIFLLMEIVIITAVVTNSVFYQVSAQSELSQLNVSIINCQTNVTKLQMLLLSSITGTTENMPSTTTKSSSDTTTDKTTNTTTKSSSESTSETTIESTSDTPIYTSTDSSTDTSTDTSTENAITTTTNIPIETTLGPAFIIFDITTSDQLSQQNKWGERVNSVLENMDAILSNITENPNAVNPSDLELQNLQMSILVTLGGKFSSFVYESDRALLLESSDATLILVNESLIAVQEASNPSPPSNSSTTLIIWLVSVLLLCIIICIVLVVWKPWKKTVTKDKDIPKWRNTPRNLERTPQPQSQSVNTQAASGTQNQGFVMDLEIEESNFAKLSIPRPVTIPMVTRNVQPSGNLNRPSSKTPEHKIAPLPRSYKSYT